MCVSSSRRPISLVRRVLFAVFVAAGVPARGDTFTYRDQNGETVEVEARLAGSGEGWHALELADGQIRRVPQAAVLKREIGPGPTPVDADGMIELLTEKFGAETFRAAKEGPYVIGLVLSAPLPRSAESRAAGFLKQAGRSMRNVESVFLQFIRMMRLEPIPPRYPLVVLIFETDEGFDHYVPEETGGSGLSAGKMAGFYSGRSNRLVLRLSECHTFETPLHEAIHQQVYNRGIFQRLAPIPRWFDEGIATGFEGNGDRINVGPNKINAYYARRALESAPFDWTDIVGHDEAFGADFLADEGYTHAWSLHWLLVSEYKLEYMKYLQMLGRKETLGKQQSPEQRLKEFEQLIGKSVGELQDEFLPTLQRSLRRQRVSLAERSQRGLLTVQTGLAEVQVSGVSHVDRGGLLEVRGRLRNISPIRPMSYYVTVQTETGLYADWYIPELNVRRTFPLEKQFLRKVMPNAPGGVSNQFTVHVAAAIPGTEKAEQWRRGERPVPVFQRSLGQ